MNIKQIFAVIKLNSRLQLADPTVQFIMILVPLIMAPFMLPSAKTQLIAEGYIHANGAEQVIPGLAILFSFFSIQLIIQMFFDETIWNTWDRQQISATSITEIITGKAVVAYSIQVVQLSTVILISGLLFKFHINGSWFAFITIVISFAATLTFFGIMLVSWSKSSAIALSLSNLLGILMAGLGGSLSPVNSFPHWARILAKIDPAYWGLLAIKKISLDHGNFNTVSQSLSILWIMTIIFCLLSLFGFHFRPLKEGNN
ncbi:ABC transporter permease [Liquorilactobacillus mali]|uniref:Multidrug ABC transporter permease n=1 Tax=Liquorilactobacillus mali KCTC 3596 = DSM 20444 TaxID=1046596 RepID=J0KYS2_9LACO|nr:ABC transporter permease [Liquorilactobacillus mali]EJE99363.1 multidrug ABC transporter permease [Liquorilactobacillus mali KCTC 3596 = DSM 20444]KRN09331.1 multidrug ABC transporter permease [Liquorilactobacillus mali KCTC 3596 = DSM 20444]QFQ74667.1 ABC transporter permease [Liquorilactobacillus mali]